MLDVATQCDEINENILSCFILSVFCCCFFCVYKHDFFISKTGFLVLSKTLTVHLDINMYGKVLINIINSLV